MKRIRKLISIIIKSSVLNRNVDAQMKLKHQFNDSETFEQNKNIKHTGFILDMRIRWGSSYEML